MARMSQEISDDEFRDACNRGNLFDVQLDTKKTVEGGYNQDEVTEGMNDPYRPLDSDEEGGAGRADSRRSRSLEEAAPHITKSKEADGNSDDRRIGKASRDQDRSTKNSTAYDKASYEAEGMAAVTLAGRFPFFSNPKDRSLWEDCLEESYRAYPEGGNKSFALWLYKKRGGKWGF